MAGFAVDLSDIDDDPMILFLESHHRVMGATDDAATVPVLFSSSQEAIFGADPRS